MLNLLYIHCEHDVAFEPLIDFTNHLIAILTLAEHTSTVKDGPYFCRYLNITTFVTELQPLIEVVEAGGTINW